MKRFRKSIVALALGCLLLVNLSGGAVWAEGYADDYAYSWVEVIDAKAYLNDTGIDVKMAYGSDWNWRGAYEYMQFAPVLRQAGYEVSYDAEEDSVAAEKDGKKVIIFLKQDENWFNKVWMIEDGRQKETYFSCLANEYQGTAYIRIMDVYNEIYSDFWRDIFGFEVRMWRNVCYFFEEEPLREHIRSKLAHLENIPSYNGLVNNYTNTATGKIGFDLSSDMFGISVKGESGVNSSLVKNGEKYKAAIQMDNGGVFSFISLFNGPYKTGLNYYKDKIDLTQPISAQAIYDGKDLYGTGDCMVEDMILSYLGRWYMYPPENDFREIAAERIDGKWVKAWLTESDREYTLNPILEAINAPKIDVDELTESILHSVINDYYGMEGNIYDAMLKRIDVLTGLLGPEALQYVESNGEKVITYKLNSDIFDKLKAAYEYNTESNSIYDEMELELNARTVIYADNTAKSTTTGTFKINNIPNDYNIPFGSMTITLDVQEDVVPQAAEINAPADYVDFQQLYEESLPYRSE